MGEKKPGSPDIIFVPGDIDDEVEADQTKPESREGHPWTGAEMKRYQRAVNQMLGLAQSGVPWEQVAESMRQAILESGFGVRPDEETRLIARLGDLGVWMSGIKSNNKGKFPAQRIVSSPFSAQDCIRIFERAVENAKKLKK